MISLSPRTRSSTWASGIPLTVASRRASQALSWGFLGAFATATSSEGSTPMAFAMRVRRSCDGMNLPRSIREIVASVVSEDSASSIWVRPAATRRRRRFAGMGLVGVGFRMAGADPENDGRGTTPDVDRVLDLIRCLEDHPLS